MKGPTVCVCVCAPVPVTVLPGTGWLLVFLQCFLWGHLSWLEVCPQCF